MTAERPSIPGEDTPDLTVQAIGAVLRTLKSGMPEPPFPGDRQTAPESIPARESPVPQEVAATVEPAAYDTISVFAGWGQGLEPFHDDDDMTPAMRKFWQEIQMRGRVNKEIREALIARGVRISEPKDHTSRRPDQNEIAMNPRIDNGWLNEALPGITSDAQPIPSEDFASYMQHQTLPILVYVEGLAGGEGKITIDTPEQIQKIVRLLAEKPWAEAQFKPLLKFKPIIETPSDRYTSFRVLVTPMGDIIGSGLLYSPERESEHTTPSATPVDLYFHSYSKTAYFTDPYSPYYLNGGNITSNISGGGGCIPLNPTEHSRPITDNEREILAAHGMSDQALLEPIQRAAQKIGKRLGGQGGLVYGLDFMLDTDGGIWFLEAGADPGVQTMNEVANGGAKDTEQGYRLLMTRAIDSVFPQG